MQEHPIPEGFVPISMPGGFDRQFGPIYRRDDGKEGTLAFRVQEHHLNGVNTLHGGALATFADWQTYLAKRIAGLTIHTPTIKMNVEYFAPAHLDDWVEAQVSLDKETGRMLFTRAEFRVKGKLIARSTAIYAINRKKGIEFPAN